MKFINILAIFFVPFFACSKSYTYMADGIFFEYAKEMKQKKNLTLVGTGGEMPNRDVKSLYMAFESYEKLSIHEARKLYIDLVDGLVNKTNADKGIQPFLHDHPCSWKNINIDLLFANSDLTFVSDGHIAGVSRINENLCYRIYKKDTECLETFYREPYEEALSIVQQEQMNQSP